MQKDLYSIRLEDLVARTIGMGREVATAIGTSDLSRSPHEIARVTRCLARLSKGEPLDPGDCGGFETVRNILIREIAQETIGMVRTFRGFSDPEEGDIGTVIEHAVVSDRGADLDRLLGDFERFLFMRQVVLDRMAAEQVVAGMGQA